MINVNEYFDGTVKSLGYETALGKSSLGVMEAGDFEFGTSTHETMTVVQGVLNVQLPGSEEWKAYGAGESFEIEANKSFKVKTTSFASYLCEYK